MIDPTDFIPVASCQDSGRETVMRGDSGGPILFFDEPTQKFVQLGVISSGRQKL